MSQHLPIEYQATDESVFNEVAVRDNRSSVCTPSANITLPEQSLKSKLLMLLTMVKM